MKNIKNTLVNTQLIGHTHASSFLLNKRVLQSKRITYDRLEHDTRSCNSFLTMKIKASNLNDRVNHDSVDHRT